ncbi:Ankyrin repeat-containing domain protein [Metarhizium robertsii ARSEF 23]|uniref:Ankyrin repeat-containing domain protein n=1 Tax=Metarhizium robertsii (strain ARSEF 23 / ATCC MYA-3075) TaxID=655844 RepID=A0A0B2XG60_METRA|nr:Ankyrin repeat-containing domain protein [Metarhizium robertsii ARSEF 23]KHO10936.1 Ankyrin repeat-containing domain protein [Metarhizium robertsii ARSEF 23]
MSSGSTLCARCGEKKPTDDFVSKRKSARNTKNCLDCRNQSRDAIQTLKSLAVGPSSSESPALKRTEEDADLSPPNDRSGTQPTSSESIRQGHTARTLFKASISQPRVELGTPLPPTQQSSGLLRTLAPSPPMQRMTHPIVSLSDPGTVRNSTTSVDHAYLATRYRRGGKDSQDNPSTAGARVKLAAIQRDHRSRRRAGETVSLTPSISQLGVFEALGGPREVASQDQPQRSGFPEGGEIGKEWQDGGQFSESDVDAEDFFNLLLSPVRPRRYLEQLGAECDSDPGDEDNRDDDDSVDESPLRHRRGSLPQSQGLVAVLAVVLPLVQEGGQKNLKGKLDRRGRHDGTGVQ